VLNLPRRPKSRRATSSPAQHHRSRVRNRTVCILYSIPLIERDLEEDFKPLIAAIVDTARYTLLYQIQLLRRKILDSAVSAERQPSAAGQTGVQREYSDSCRLVG